MALQPLPDRGSVAARVEAQGPSYADPGLPRPGAQGVCTGHAPELLVDRGTLGAVQVEQLRPLVACKRPAFPLEEG